MLQNQEAFYMVIGWSDENSRQWDNVLQTKVFVSKL